MSNSQGHPGPSDVNTEAEPENENNQKKRNTLNLTNYCQPYRRSVRTTRPPDKFKEYVCNSTTQQQANKKKKRSAGPESYKKSH